MKLKSNLELLKEISSRTNWYMTKFKSHYDL